ncbi:protein RIC-3 [Pelodytes ibericus]
MALSTIQKVAVFSCLVLCISLLLPKTFLSRGKQSGQTEGNPSQFPSSLHQPKPTDGRTPSSYFPRSHLSEAMSKAKGGNVGGGSNVKQSLVGQIIPIYGFGILLYILYILFKLSSKGKSPTFEQKSQPISNGNHKRKITDYELSQLQDKLKETEEAMEKIISRLGPNCEREDNVSTDEEQQLLKRLKEITRVMKEGKLVDPVSPEQEAEEAPYMEDWEGYPEETYPVYDPSACKRKPDTILVDCSVLTQPSAEEIAEQMEFTENNLCAANSEKGPTCSLPNLTPNNASPPQTEFPLPETQAQTFFSCEEEEEDEDEDDNPEFIAENAGFNPDAMSEPMEVNNYCMDSDDERESTEATGCSSQDNIGPLRKRKKGIEY